MPDKFLESRLQEWNQAWKDALRDKAEAELKRRAIEIRRRTAAALVIEDRAEIEEAFYKDAENAESA